MLVRTPEPLRTLLACLSSPPQSDIDWATVIAGANRALVTGILADRLRGIAPAEVDTFLKTIRARIDDRNARLDAQLAEALVALNMAGIRPILLKGAAILRSAGPNYGGRLISDLDLMVPAAAMPAAAASLHELGYRDHAPTRDSLAARTLFRAQDVGMIDLHARTKVRHPGFAYGDLTPDCTVLAFGGGHALLPSATMQALILILHDQLQERDYWRGLLDLRHLLDLAALAQAGYVDWDALAARFPSGYPRRALRVQLATLAVLLHVPVPRHLHADGWTRVQVERRLAQLRHPWLRVPFTLATLACDPPWFTGLVAEKRMPIEHTRLSRARLPAWLRHLLAAGRRLFSADALGKF